MGKVRNKPKPKLRPNPSHLQRRCTFYEPEFKRTVAMYAEQNGTGSAKCKFGVSDSNIRRWRRVIRGADAGGVVLEEAAQKARNRGRKDNVKGGGVKEASPSALDSMPLQQRLQAPPLSTSEQEPVLHSQPLSPTKLKVTRHSKPAQAAHTTAHPLQPPIEEVCLKWNSHHSNMQNSFPSLLLREQYVDATLVADGQTLKCHRVILSSCSTYFEEVLSSISPYQHPVLFMKDTPFWILKSLCDYMYAGEVHIPQAKLHELLTAAAILKIKGLSEQPVVGNPAVKTEPQESIKEEKGEEEDVKRREDTRKREEKDSRKKEDTKKKEDREVRKKDEVKKKEEVKEVKDKKRNQVTPPPEMPVLKSAKLSKVTQHNEMPNLSKNNKSSRVGNSRRSAKRSEKVVESITKEPSSMFLDPLDLLEPVYEEITKEPLPTSTPKETKTVPVRRSFPKKLKKRKITDDRDDSPQPVLSRRGTRSRPNRKVPKFYHSNFDNSTIVREPHTDQADPLMQLQEIKSEPLYLEDNAIEIEDNLVGFSEQEITLHEEIMGDYDSPIVNFARGKADLDPPVSGKSENTLKIVNVEDIRGATGQEEDPLHVHNVIENNENCLGFRISEVVTQKEDSRSTELGFEISNVVSEKEEPAACDNVFRISNVLSVIEEAGSVKEPSKEDKNDADNSSESRLQDNSVPNQPSITDLETGNDNFERSNEETEYTPDLQNVDGLVSNQAEDIQEEDASENASDTSTCAGFQNSDVQSALNADSFRSDVEKMQVDDDTEDLPTAEGSSCPRIDTNVVEDADFAGLPVVQTENDVEVCGIAANIGEKLPQSPEGSSSNTPCQQTTCVTSQFGFHSSPNGVENPPELRLEATKSNEMIEEPPDISKLDLSEFVPQNPGCSDSTAASEFSEIPKDIEPKFNLTVFGGFSNPEFADTPNAAGFFHHNNPDGIENSAELKPTDSECCSTPNSPEFSCPNNLECTENLAELRPEFAETLQTPPDVIPADAEFTLPGFDHHGSGEIENPEATELPEETPSINRLTNTKLRPTSGEPPGEATDTCSGPTDCAKSSDSPHINDLEAIVNDLRKIVGGSGPASVGEGEDSSAIAESLENLLNE